MTVSAVTPTSPGETRASFITLSPTSTSVVPAPNNISCNVPNSVAVANNPPNGVVASPRSEQQGAVSPQRSGAAGRERRPRSVEERRDGSGRRRSGRNNRNSVTAAAAAPAGAAPSNGKLDLPPGYGASLLIPYGHLNF